MFFDRRSVCRALAVAALALPGAAAVDAVAATPTIKAAQNFSIGLKSDGTIVSWGEDSNFQLGNGRVTYSPTPAQVSPLARIRSISCGDVNALALGTDGTVWAWGTNQFGGLGDGTTTGRVTPARIAGLSGVVAISTGNGHSMALGSNGKLWAWGNNVYGQVGVGVAGGWIPSPIVLAETSDVTAIIAGQESSYVITSDGSVWAWGRNQYGQLGDGTTIDRYSPVRLAGISGVGSLSAGKDHTIAVKRDGSVWTWGSDQYGQLGEGSGNVRSAPAQVNGISGVASVSAGWYASYAVRSDASVWAWGTSGTLGLGDGATRISPTPVRIPGLPAIAAVSAGGLHRIAMATDGGTWVWGDNSAGQLGDGTTADRATPVRLAGLASVSGVCAAMLSSVALDSQGNVLAWGTSAFGHLGKDPMLRSTPGAIAGISDVIAISAGSFSGVALRSDGSVWEWGGRTTFDPARERIIDFWRSRPVQVEGVSSVRAVSSMRSDTFAVKSDGSVWAWGANESGQIGDGTTTRRSSPVQLQGVSGVSAIATGTDHALVLRSDGTVWAWGRNTAGQLGNGTTANSLSPAPVPGLTNVIAIAAGNEHSLAIKADGSVWAWGLNNAGQLGDGTTTSRTTPVRVLQVAGATAIAAGGLHSLALGSDGRLWAWGYNEFGQLGDGTTLDRATPVVIVANASDVAAISGGLTHSLIVKRDGSVLGWGTNNSGELGDGTLANRLVSVVARRENGAGSIAAGDWYLDLAPSVPTTIPPEKIPAFLAVATGAGTVVDSTLQFRPQDVGSVGSVYVFAVAPVDRVKKAPDGSAPLVLGKTVSKSGTKEEPVACVLAQLNAQGLLQTVTGAQLQAYQTGVLSAQGTAVNVLNGTSAVNTGGAIFYVGYGNSGTTMLSQGLNRSVVSVPATRECRPQAPQTGWWWNPKEDGRGFSLEVRGNNIFFASFLYDVSGRSTWYVSTGPVSLDGSLYVGDLLSARGGQSLGGAYPGFPTLASVGTVTLAFNTPSQGTMVWPGGIVPIERFNIVPNGLNQPPVAGQPENGWWWNEQEAGRGFFMEWQGGTLDIAGYMYDDTGNSVWYLTEGPIGGTTSARSFAGNWWSFGNGQTLTGPWKPNTQLSNNVAPVTITFSGADTAIMTLPNGRTTNLRRHRF